MGRKYLMVKRFLDVVISYFLLLVLYFPMLIISVAIKISDGGPVLFKQKRIGKDGRAFMCYKFRTMRCDAPRNMSTKDFINASEYVTPIGSFLRRTSLDELPQLFNVLSGEMSLVGPRPLIPEEKEVHFIRKERGAYKVRPGITGLAQICGRDELADPRKVECDIIYAENVCLRIDVKIIFATVKKVILGEGITKKVINA